jgi:ferredoxin
MSEETKNSGKKGAYVDPDLCIGCMLCTQICPKVFEMQSDGKSKAVNPISDTEENIQEAIDQCPVDAISWK